MYKTKTLPIPFNDAKKKELVITYDQDEKSPVSYHLDNDQLWALDTISLAKIFLRSHSNVLDVGSHIGSFSLLASTYTDANIICIEPEPKNFELLRINIDQNNVKNAQLHNLAASNTSGSVQFCSNGPSSHLSFDGCTEASVSVPAATIDSLNVGPIDFIKIDVEGHELATFAGMENVIKNWTPPIIFEANLFTLKWFDKTPNDIIDYLQTKFGYFTFLIYNKLIPINQYEPFPTGVADCIAIHPRHMNNPNLLRLIDLPLNANNRESLINKSYFEGNEDIKGALDWYLYDKQNYYKNK